MEARNAVKTIITISYKMILFALIVMLVYYAGGAAFRFGVAVFHESAVDAPDQARVVYVDIPSNPTIEEVAEALQECGAVEEKWLFYVQARFSSYAEKFVGGTFEINTGMTPTEIMAAITAESQTEEDS